MCLPVLAEATTTAEIGVGVLLAALRHPVILAKQLASIDAISGGRLLAGVGAGWMAEEFEILDVPFASRGERLDEWITILRRCWTGEPGPIRGKHYSVPDGTFCYPTPARQVPVIVGGMSPPALRRAAVVGDGWLALPRPSDDMVAVIRDGLALARKFAAAEDRDLPDGGASSTRTTRRTWSPSCRGWRNWVLLTSWWTWTTTTRTDLSRRSRLCAQPRHDVRAARSEPPAAKPTSHSERRKGAPR